MHKVKYFLWRTRYYIFFLFCIAIFSIIYQYTSILSIHQVILDSSNGEKLSYVDKDKAESDINWVNGKKYFNINIEDIKKVFNNNPFVSSILVTKIFPNTILVYIKERKPFVSLEIDNNTCVLLDQESFVLSKSDGNCADINTKYMPIQLSIEDPKISFVENTQSTYYQVSNIVKITKIFAQYNLGITKITIKNTVMAVNANEKKNFVFSLNQDIVEQLTRMSAVMPQIEMSQIKYTSLDLRFERPVLTK